MLKFKYNYLTNNLAYQTEPAEIWYEITEQFQGNFNSLGFNLTSGWMTFTIYEKQIKVFYKQVQAPTNLEDFWTPTSHYLLSEISTQARGSNLYFYQPRWSRKSCR